LSETSIRRQVWSYSILDEAIFIVANDVDVVAVSRSAAGQRWTFNGVRLVLATPRL
jgi:hypothetical protein